MLVLRAVFVIAIYPLSVALPSVPEWEARSGSDMMLLAQW